MASSQEDEEAYGSDSQEIEEMRPYADHLMSSAHPDESDWGAVGPLEIGGEMSFPGNIKDAQQLLDMIGEKPISEEMLQKLQEHFGSIEIEIVKESSEESIEQDPDNNSVDEAITVDDDVASGSFNVWPQQPILYASSAGNSTHVPLIVEIEQAEEVQRLSQEVSSHMRVHGMLDDTSKDEDDNGFNILGAKSSSEDRDQIHLQHKDNFKTKTQKQAHSGLLRPPWLSPVPFLQPSHSYTSTQEEVSNGSPDNSSITMHSTPRISACGEDEADVEEDAGLSYHNYEGGDEEDIMDEAQPMLEYEDMEVNIEKLTKDQIQELLMSAQMEGLPFDPRLIDLATAHGLEFEIVMEDEDGNVIDRLPDGEPMTSSNFADLVQELKVASGQDMEMSIQYDSGIGTGNTIAGAVAGTHNQQSLNDLQQELQKHIEVIGHASVNQELQYSNTENVPTTSLEDLHDASDTVLKQAIHKHSPDGRDCNCPDKPQDGRKTARGGRNRQTTQHFHNSDRKLGAQKKHSSGEYFQRNNASYTEETQNRESENKKQESPKSSDGETDNEIDERGQRFGSNRSEKSFSSSTSVDGVIDTRMDQSESEEEIVITMEVPGIPTEDGGFIIDMSKMFIPISIPGQGDDKEITVEIDPSNFDFSNMVTNEDGTIEVDIEREVHNWMAKSSSKFVHYSSSGAPSPGVENVVYTSPNSTDGTKTSGQIYDNCDTEVNSAIRAAITEQLHFPNKSSSDDSTWRVGPTIRPLSETPPQLDSSTAQHDSSRTVSASDSSSFFDVCPAEDEILQLLEQIGKHGVEMRKELQNSKEREICLYQEKGQEEVRLASTVTLLEKELHSVRSENKKLYKEINCGKNTGKRNKGMIHRLESAMEDLQSRLHTIQRDNTDLKKVNATLERRSKMVMHKYTMTNTVVSEEKSLQAGTSMFKCRARAVQTTIVHKVDFSMQIYGHQFMRNAITSTHDPIFQSLRSKNNGAQTASKIVVDRGVIAMTMQEKLWFGSVANAVTQVRAVSKQHDHLITRKKNQDASTVTVAIEPGHGISPIPKMDVSILKDAPNHDAKYPWHQARNTEPQQQRRTSTPHKANQPHQPKQVKPGPKQLSTISQTKSSIQAVDKLFNQIQGGESPVMENSATESMDTDEEPEGPDKWQRLSSAPLTSDPTVIKLQRSLASAALENDLLHGKMKKVKVEMSTRLREWADLLAASKVELNQAKYDAIELAARHRSNPTLDSLHQKISLLEQTLVSAEVQNTQLAKQLEAAQLTKVPVMAEAPTFELEKENLRLKATLDKIQQERDQLVKDFANLRKHHRHSTEAVTDLESSFVGMASKRHNLQKEVQVLRNEYKHLKKGMELMEQYFNKNVVDEADNRPTFASSQAASIIDDAVQEPEAVLIALKQSDQVTKQSEAAVNALKDRNQGDEVVIIPSGGVEGSLHKHISVLAARIQSELGIKVQLVGEVDPVEILGASIHSQEVHTTSTPTPSQDDLTRTNAVEHLFQSVGTDGVISKPNGGLINLQDVEDIIARAIPSPRDTSPSSPCGGFHTEVFDTNDIEYLDAVELRRKRLGMFVESYTKSRSTSPETRVSSPRSARSPVPAMTKRHNTSRLSKPEMTLEDLEMPLQGEPSTDHHMKMHRESRHQIQTQQPPWASNSSRNEDRTSSLATTNSQDSVQKPEMIRKKLTTNTQLLPSKFSMSSFGVPKSFNAAPALEESVQQQPQQTHLWAQPRWQPFSRLAKTARLKHEVRPPPRDLSHDELEAEATFIQEEILSRYAGDVQINDDTTCRQQVPVPELEHAINKVIQKQPIPVKETNRSVGRSHTEPEKSGPKGSRYEQNTSVKISQPVLQPRQSYPNQAKYTSKEKPTSVTRPSTQAPLPLNDEKSTLFKDYDYTDYLLAKYCGEEESTDATLPTDTTPQSSSQENGEVSSSDSDTQTALTSRWVHPPDKPRPTHHISRARVSSGISHSPRSSPSQMAQNSYYSRQEEPSIRTDSNPRYSGRPEVKSRATLGSSSRSPVYSSNASSRPSSRPELHSRSTMRSDNHGTSSHSDSPQRSPTRPHSNPSLRSEVGSKSSHHSDAPRKPWHSDASSYTTPDPQKSKPRSYYSKYLDKTDNDDRCWAEPKPYDYRHDLSTARKEPQRNDSYRDSERLWPDSQKPTSSYLVSSSSYSNKPSSWNSYEAYSNNTTATPDGQLISPYQSIADRYRFSSRPELEMSTAGSSLSYYPHSCSSGGVTIAPSGYSHKYDRPLTTPPHSRRYYTSRADDMPSVSADIPSRPLVTNADYNAGAGSPASATTIGNFLHRPPPAGLPDDPFISGIVDKYSITGSGRGRHVSGITSETATRGRSNAAATTTTTSDLAEKYLGGKISSRLSGGNLTTPNYGISDPYSTGIASDINNIGSSLRGGSNRYGSVATSGAYCTSRVERSIYSTPHSQSFLASHSDRPESSYSRVVPEVGGYSTSGYGRYYSASHDSGPALRPRDRRAEIEELLDKYAPIN